MNMTERVYKVDHTVIATLEKTAIPLLGVTLAVVYMWFDLLRNGELVRLLVTTI